MNNVQPAESAWRNGLRPALVEINLARLTANYRNIENAAGAASVMPVIKSNAYGHGLIEVGRHYVRIGVQRLAVALLEEGIALRHAGIAAPISILGALLPEQIVAGLRHALTLSASSIEMLRYIDAQAEALRVKPPVHLEIDTGMERTGVRPYEAARFLEESLRCRAVNIEGIFTHFANADLLDLTSARLQIERFQEVLRFYERRSIPQPLRHMASSAGILQLPESHFDLVRPGIMLYGIYPSAECARTIAIRPALSLKARLSYVKMVEANSPLSYGWTWRSDHRVRIATVPLGYGDGYSRRLSNKAHVLMRGKRYPIAGRVCMDQFMVNLESDEAAEGDVVTLIGEEGDESIRCDDLAELLGTNPYEVLTNLNTRLPRVYVNEE
jgi:alanine racemase